MVKRIAVFGVQSHSGKIVSDKLMEAGFQVCILSPDSDAEKDTFHPGIEWHDGNWMYHHDLIRFLRKMDAVYCSLSVDMQEKQEDFHAETDGLREILNVSLECGIKRIAYMSSVLQYNQVENEKLWWVFNVKKDAVNYVRDCGIPFTIFYPSVFMENFLYTYRHKKRLRLFGVSRFPIYFVSMDDYADMVVRSFSVPGTEDREYFIQGQDCYNMQEAAKLFVKHSSHKMKIRTVSEGMMRFLAMFSTKWQFIYELADALNNNTEMFIAEDTWKELGEPKTTFIQFAKKH